MPVWRVSLWRVSHFFVPKLHRSVFYVRLARISFCAYVDRLWAFLSAKKSFYVRISFFAYFPLYVVHHLFINLVNVHRGYTIVDLFISRFWTRFRLQNGYATQRDVCVVIVQGSRSRPCRVCVGGVFFMAYLLCAVHHLFINLVNVSSRLHISGLV